MDPSLPVDQPYYISGFFSCIGRDWTATSTSFDFAEITLTGSHNICSIVGCDFQC